MFCRKPLIGLVVVAFGAGLLLSALIPAGFLILFFAVILVVVGAGLCKKRW